MEVGQKGKGKGRAEHGGNGKDIAAIVSRCLRYMRKKNVCAKKKKKKKGSEQLEREVDESSEKLTGPCPSVHISILLALLIFLNRLLQIAPSTCAIY
jgi:hypothetical protein